LKKSEIEKNVEKNRERRRKFVREWAEYVKSHSDEKWSKQQNVIINSQIKTAKQEAKQKK
jgi:hypothetical protein